MQFSEAFKIDRTGQDDWFDPDLSIDTRLFLDPFLLLDEKENRESPFADAHDQLIGHFARCYELLANAGAKGTLGEQTARALLTFPEPAELCLGYTAAGTAGSGGGQRQARLIVGSIVTAIAAGITTPEHIEEIGILNEGIGADRISDAACNVLKPLLIDYTKEVMARHRLDGEPQWVRHSRCSLKTGRWLDDEHDLLKNPITGGPILLVPRRFLNRLPTLNADDWFHSTFNSDLRRDLNVEVGARVSKEEIVRVARRHPERIRQWADELRAAGDVKGYDFEADPLGVVSWQRAGQEFAAMNPVSLTVAHAANLREFVEELLRLFKLFIEEQSGWRLLWNDDGTEKPEEAAQLALLGMARPYCRAHGVEIDREVNLGRGPVDFKLSSGTSTRLLIEAKKLHNGDFWNGLEYQLTAYLTSDDTRDGWLLALQYRTGGVSARRASELARRVAEANRQTGTTIGVTRIDGRRKVSASNITARTSDSEH